MRTHGTHSCFVWGPEPGSVPGRGCRCDLCRAANSAYERGRKARLVPPYVAASAARDHLAWLRTEGVGLKQVAKQSGVAHGALSKIVYGTPTLGRGPSKRIRPTTSEAILAVTPSQGARGSRVPAGPVWADVNRLLGRGWTKSAIARAIGQGRALQLGEVVVTRRNATAVHALLDQPVPTDVGKAWSAHHRALAVPEPTAEPERYSRDHVILGLVELLEARIDENPWRKDAACRGRPSWMFFPGRGDHKTIAAAKKICGACFVRDQCLQANLGERDGVYGGTTGHERRAMREATA